MQGILGSLALTFTRSGEGDAFAKVQFVLSLCALCLCGENTSRRSKTWKRVRVHTRAPRLWHPQDVSQNRQMHTAREGLRMLYVPITMARTFQE